RPSVFDHNVLAFNKARLIQSFSKRADDVEERRGGPGVEKSHDRHRRLPRARRERPRRRTAEMRDEVPPLHHSITSSAPASSVGGTSRPSALAVLRLITSSYFVGACAGRSAGFSALRLRST